MNRQLSVAFVGVMLSILLSSCASHLSRGIKHFKHNRFDLAAVELEVAVKERNIEDRAEALYYLAQVYGARGRYRETCDALYEAALLTLVRMTEVSTQAGNRPITDIESAIDRLRGALTEPNESRRQMLVKRSLNNLTEAQRDELEGTFVKLRLDRLYRLLKSINGKLALFDCNE